MACKMKFCARRAPGSSPLLNKHRKGIVASAGCDLPPFSSVTKCESGAGWRILPLVFTNR
jgi:peptide methionine sulfoxide reductase MsrB